MHPRFEPQRIVGARLTPVLPEQWARSALCFSLTAASLRVLAR